MPEKILLINGSPRKAASNSLMLARSFVKGMTDSRDLVLTEFCVAEAEIASCLGCLSCWGKTPGRCVIRDDMEKLLDLILEADYVVAAFPLYYFGLPGKMKMMLDRTLPFTMPYDGKQNGLHVPRHECLKQKHWAMVSTCGYAVTDGLFDALDCELGKVFEHGYSRVLCPQGEMLKLKDFEGLMIRYRRRLEAAGAEFVAASRLSDATEQELRKPFLPQRVFEKIVAAHWAQYDTAGADPHTT